MQKGVLKFFYTEVFCLLFQGKGLVWSAVKHFVFLCHLLKEKLNINISPPVCRIPIEILYPQVTLAGGMGVCANSKWEQVCPKQIQGCDVQ